MLHDVLLWMVITHPLPWYVDHDWTYEVIASDATVIAKCATEETAQAIIDEATRIRSELDGFELDGTALELDK